MANLRSISVALLVLCAVPAQAQLLRIYYPDIEQGSATLVVSPTGQTLLIDAGTGIKSAEDGIEDFVNGLIDAGIVTSLDFTLATQYDEDHIGRMENVLQFVPLPPTKALISMIFNFGIGRDVVEPIPCHGAPMPAKATQRDRVLSVDEIRAVWRALDDEEPVMAATFKMRLVTAQWGVEVLSMRWADIDGDSWTIPADAGNRARLPIARTGLEPRRHSVDAAHRVEIEPAPTFDSTRHFHTRLRLAKRPRHANLGIQPSW